MGYQGQNSSNRLKSKSIINKFFLRPGQESANYYRNKIRVGYREYFRLGSKIKEDFYLDVSESVVMIALGKRGSGKTYLARRIIDMLFNSDYCVVLPCDVKDEMKSSLKPAGANQFKLVAQNEEANSLPMRIFYPKYLGDPPPKNESFQISLFDMTFSDMLTLYNRLSVPQQSVLMHVYNLIRDGTIQNIDNFYEELDNIEDVSSSTKRSIRMMTDTIVRNGIIGDRFRIDLAGIFEQEQIPVLDLIGYEELGLNVAAAYVSIFLRKVMWSRKNGYIRNPMFIVIDEAHEFLKESLSSREEIQKIVNISRTFGISILLLTQNLEDIPPKIMRQARYIFMPQGITFDEGKEVFKSQTLLEWDRDSYNEMISLFRNLRRKRNKEREWLCIDTHSRDYYTFFPYAPLSSHMTERRWLG